MPSFQLLQQGTPWWAYVNLTESGRKFIVIPQRATQGGQSRQADLIGRHLTSGGRIILLGFHYDFIAANGNGFTLQWAEPPAGSPIGSDKQYQILQAFASTAITRVSGSHECFIPAPGPQYGSPNDSTSVVNAPSLCTVTTATQPTNGGILLWGIHTDPSWKPGKQFFGSPPIDFSTPSTSADH